MVFKEITDLHVHAHIHMKDKKLALSGKIPGKRFPYSDHEGVEATIELERREKPISIPERVFDGRFLMVHPHTHSLTRAHTHTHTQMPLLKC